MISIGDYLAYNYWWRVWTIQPPTVEYSYAWYAAFANMRKDEATA